MKRFVEHRSHAREKLALVPPSWSLGIVEPSEVVAPLGAARRSL